MESVQLCARCGSPIGGRVPVGGRCLWMECGRPICGGCWNVSKFRFCRGHVEGGAGERRRDLSPRLHDLPDVTPGIRALHESRTDGRAEKARFFASEYFRRLSAAVERNGPPDWTPRGILQRLSWESGTMDGAYFIRVSSGRWPGKRLHSPS